MLTKKEALEQGYFMCSKYDSFYDINEDELSEGEYTLLSPERQYWSISKDEVLSALDTFLTDQLADNISWDFASNIALEDDLKDDIEFHEAIEMIVFRVNLLLKQHPFYMETDEKMVVDHE